MIVIDIELTCDESCTEVEVHHNDQLMKTVFSGQGITRLIFDTTTDGVLTLKHKGLYNVHIVNFSIFELGNDKLRYLGVYTNNKGQSWNSHVIEPEGQWSLSYQYPVFSWLHRTLNLGWLIKPDAI